MASKSFLYIVSPVILMSLQDPSDTVAAGSSNNLDQVVCVIERTGLGLRPLPVTCPPNTH